MGIEFDTEGFPASQRFARWQAAIAELFVRLDVKTTVRDEFRMRVRRSMLGPVMWAQNTCSQQHVRRTEKHIAHDGQDLMVFLLSNRGRSVVVQGDREAVLQPGEFAMFDAARAYELQMDDDNIHTVLQVPRAMLVARAGELDKHTAVPLVAASPLARLAFDFVAGVSRTAEVVEPHIASVLSDQALDLLAMALCERIEGGTPSPSTHRASLLGRIKAIVRSRLVDPTLSPAQVAAALGISSRYVNKLLAEDGTSFERHVLACRLEQCRRDLEMARLDHRRISEVAFAWGFNDPAHFSRAFRARYGISPREWRQTRSQNPLSDQKP